MLLWRVLSKRLTIFETPPEALHTPAPSASLCNFKRFIIERFKLLLPMDTLLIRFKSARMRIYNTLFIPKSVKPFVDPLKSFRNLLTLGGRTADR